jgi:hypothetical protein
MLEAAGSSALGARDEGNIFERLLFLLAAATVAVAVCWWHGSGKEQRSAELRISSTSSDVYSLSWVCIN